MSKNKQPLTLFLDVLSKDEAKGLMKTKDFEQFFDKTSRIIERALDSEMNPLMNFFEQDNTEQVALGAKHEKMTHQFTFMETEPPKRAITSIDWSPKVSELIFNTA